MSSNKSFWDGVASAFNLLPSEERTKNCIIYPYNYPNTWIEKEFTKRVECPYDEQIDYWTERLKKAEAEMKLQTSNVHHIQASHYSLETDAEKLVYIEIAVPGFAKEEIKVVSTSSKITVKQSKKASPNPAAKYETPRFATDMVTEYGIPSGYDIKSVTLKNGMLTIVMSQKKTVIEEKIIEIQ